MKLAGNTEVQRTTKTVIMTKKYNETDEKLVHVDNEKQLKASKFTSTLDKQLKILPNNAGGMELNNNQSEIKITSPSPIPEVNKIK